MTENGTIMVSTTDATVIRKKGGRVDREIKVDDLAKNVNKFLGQLESILQQAPDIVGKFELTEFEVTAEVSANGKLSLLGTGVDLGAKGGLTFTFQKNGLSSSET